MKLKCAEESVEENKNSCVKMLNELEDLERLRQKVHVNFIIDIELIVN